MSTAWEDTSDHRAMQRTMPIYHDGQRDMWARSVRRQATLAAINCAPAIHWSDICHRHGRLVSARMSTRLPLSIADWSMTLQLNVVRMLERMQQQDLFPLFLHPHLMGTQDDQPNIVRMSECHTVARRRGLQQKTKQALMAWCLWQLLEREPVSVLLTPGFIVRSLRDLLTMLGLRFPLSSLPRKRECRSRLPDSPKLWLILCQYHVSMTERPERRKHHPAFRAVQRYRSSLLAQL